MYSGNTGFILAARNGHLKIVEFLLTKGASVDENNISGKIQISIFLTMIYLSMYLSFDLYIYLFNFNKCVKYIISVYLV